MERRRILILSDSNGREMFTLLKSCVQSQYNVFSFMKPGAKLKDVVDSVNKLAHNFGRDDFILIVGGTNDVTGDGKYETTIGEALQMLMPISLKTNLIVTEIPPNYFRKMYKVIKEANKFMKNSIIAGKRNKTFASSVIFMKIEKLRRCDFTRHGLHMNIKGKRKLAWALTNTIQAMKIQEQQLKLRKAEKKRRLAEKKKAENEALTPAKEKSNRNPKKSRKKYNKNGNKNATKPDDVQTPIVADPAPVNKKTILKAEKSRNNSNQVVSNRYSKVKRVPNLGQGKEVKDKLKTSTAESKEDKLVASKNKTTNKQLQNTNNVSSIEISSNNRVGNTVETITTQASASNGLLDGGITNTEVVDTSSKDSIKANEYLNFNYNDVSDIKVKWSDLVDKLDDTVTFEVDHTSDERNETVLATESNTERLESNLHNVENEPKRFEEIKNLEENEENIELLDTKNNIKNDNAFEHDIVDLSICHRNTFIEKNNCDLDSADSISVKSNPVEGILIEKHANVHEENSTSNTDLYEENVLLSVVLYLIDTVSSGESYDLPLELKPNPELEATDVDLQRENCCEDTLNTGKSNGNKNKEDENDGFTNNIDLVENSMLEDTNLKLNRLTTKPDRAYERTDICSNENYSFDELNSDSVEESVKVDVDNPETNCVLESKLENINTDELNDNPCPHDCENKPGLSNCVNIVSEVGETSNFADSTLCLDTVTDVKDAIDNSNVCLIETLSSGESNDLTFELKSNPELEATDNDLQLENCCEDSLYTGKLNDNENKEDENDGFTNNIDLLKNCMPEDTNLKLNCLTTKPDRAYERSEICSNDNYSFDKLNFDSVEQTIKVHVDNPETNCMIESKLENVNVEESNDNPCPRDCENKPGLSDIENNVSEVEETLNFTDSTLCLDTVTGDVKDAIDNSNVCLIETLSSGESNDLTFELKSNSELEATDNDLQLENCCEDTLYTGKLNDNENKEDENDSFTNNIDLLKNCMPEDTNLKLNCLTTTPDRAYERSEICSNDNYSFDKLNSDSVEQTIKVHVDNPETNCMIESKLENVNVEESNDNPCPRDCENKPGLSDIENIVSEVEETLNFADSTLCLDTVTGDVKDAIDNSNVCLIETLSSGESNDLTFELKSNSEFAATDNDLQLENCCEDSLYTGKLNDNENKEDENDSFTNNIDLLKNCMPEDTNLKLNCLTTKPDRAYERNEICSNENYSFDKLNSDSVEQTIKVYVDNPETNRMLECKLENVNVDESNDNPCPRDCENKPGLSDIENNVSEVGETLNFADSTLCLDTVIGEVKDASDNSNVCLNEVNDNMISNYPKDDCNPSLEGTDVSLCIDYKLDNSLGSESNSVRLKDENHNELQAVEKFETNVNIFGDDAISVSKTDCESAYYENKDNDLFAESLESSANFPEEQECNSSEECLKTRDNLNVEKLIQTYSVLESNHNILNVEDLKNDACLGSGSDNFNIDNLNANMNLILFKV